MRKGQTVPVHKDPDTRTIVEGYAKLKELTFQNSHVEFWLVEFRGSKRKGQRVFYKQAAKPKPAAPAKPEKPSAHSILASLYD